MTAFEKKIPRFKPIHLSHGNEMSITELVEKIISVSGCSKHAVEYDDKKVGYVERNFANCDLSRKLLYFSPVVTLEEGLRETWEWFLRKSSNGNT